jgi:hypothetical protein
VISGQVSEKHLIERELAQRSPVVAGLPYYYQVHLNKLCNQKCIMCMPDGRHPHDEMPLERFVAFFEQVRPFAEHITFDRWGTSDVPLDR